MLEVLPMDEDHAFAMMQKKIGMQDQRDDIMRLATALDFMPLAMAQAAAYIHKRAPRCSVQQYTEKLHRSQKSKLSLLNRDETDLRRDREACNSIISTWQISFEHVRNVRPSAADLLSFMSFFDRQAIPEALLLASTIPGSDDVGESCEDDDPRQNDLGDSQSDSDSRTDELEEDIQLLRDYSFISVTSDSALFEMHALVQLATQTWLRDNATYFQWRDKFIEVLDGKFPARFTEDWPKAENLYPHAFAALQLGTTGTHAQPLLASLLYNAGHYAYWTCAYENAERLWSTSLRISTQNFGSEHPQTRLRMGWLAQTYFVQRRLEKAEELSLQILKLPWSYQCFGEIDSLKCMIRLTQIYRWQNRLQKAEQLSLKILEQCSHDDEDLMAAMENLAITYRFQERWEEAEQVLLQAVRIAKKSDGSDMILYALDSTHALGLLYVEQGRLHEAERNLLQVQDERQTVLGNHDLATLKAMHDVGGVYLKQGRLDEAEMAFSRVHQSMAAHVGADHPSTLDTMEALAEVYREQGRVDAAKELYTRIVESRKSTLGADHPDTLNTMMSLSQVEEEKDARKQSLRGET
jgi:tetratricopeptide (TPR) repeat protein